MTNIFTHKHSYIHIYKRPVSILPTMFQTHFTNKNSIMLFKEHKNAAFNARDLFKATLSVLQALLLCIRGQIHVEVFNDFFLLQYVFPVKPKKRCKNKVLDTLNQMSSAFLLQDCLFTAQQTNVNHTPNTSSVNSSSCSFTSTFKLVPFTLIHSHPCLCFTREDLCFPRSLSNLIL